MSKSNSIGLSSRIVNTSPAYVNTVNERIAALRAIGKPILDCCQAVLDVPPPSSVSRLLAQMSEIEPSIFGLTRCEGISELRVAIAEYRAGSTLQGISMENILITAGANHAAVVCLCGLTDPNDQVVLFSPYFFNHKMQSDLIARSQTIVLDATLDFMLDDASILEALAGAPRVVMLTNPVNPTGQLINRRQLGELQYRACAKGATLIVDETYFEFTDVPENLGPEEGWDLESTVLVGSFSKSFSLAGLRVGYVISTPERIRQFVKAQDASMICSGTLAQRAALAALRDRDAHIPRVWSEIKKRSQAMTRMLLNSGLFERVIGGNGVHVFAKLLIQCSSKVAAEQLLEQSGIACLPGSTGGPAGEGWLRFSCGRLSVSEVEAFSRDKMAAPWK